MDNKKTKKKKKKKRTLLLGYHSLKKLGSNAQYRVVGEKQGKFETRVENIVCGERRQDLGIRDRVAKKVNRVDGDEHAFLIRQAQVVALDTRHRFFLVTPHPYPIRHVVEVAQKGRDFFVERCGN